MFLNYKISNVYKVNNVGNMLLVFKFKYFVIT